MGGKEMVAGYIKDGFNAGVMAVDRAVRYAEQAPLAGRVIGLGRQAVYMAGTQAIFDKVVRDERQEIRHQIRGDMLVVAMRGAALRTVPRETLAELDAVLRYMDVFGPQTHEEYVQLEGEQAAPPEHFARGQLLRLLTDAQRRQTRF